MTREEIVRNIVLGLILVLLQVLLFKRLSIGWIMGGVFYLHIIVFPAAIMLLPLRTHWLAVMLVAFAMGLVVDTFYESPGVHTSAAVLIGYLRRYILAALAPPEGYNMATRLLPDSLGFPWFFRYSLIFMGGYLFWYYLIEVFTLYYFGQIILKTFCTLLLSIAIIWMGLVVYRPKVVSTR